MRAAFALGVTAVLLFSAAAVSDDNPPLPLGDDSRLSTKLDLELYCEPLSLFTDTLSKATGVKIKARRDIADQNVSAFAKGISAADAMASVSRVFGYKWEVSGDDPDKRTYLLSRPQKKKIQAEETRKAEWRKKDQEFKDWIEDSIKMVDADASAWQKAFDKNPVQAAYDYMRKDAFRQLGWFTRAQRDDIWKHIEDSPEGELRIPFAQLAPSLQKFWKDKATNEHAEYPEWTPSPDGLDESYFVISRSTEFAGGVNISGLPLRSGIYIGVEDYGLSGPCIMSKDARTSDFLLDKLRGAGVDISAYKPLKPDYIAPDSKSKRLSIKYHVDKTKREHTGHTFGEVLQAASEKFDAGIFADDYLCRYRNHWSFRASFPDKLEEALEEVGREFRYEPTTSGKIARLRCSTWYMDERYEVPKRLVVRWAEAKKKQGRLELKDYIGIAAALDNSQVKGLRSADLGGDTPLGDEAWRMTSEVDNLRLCSTFNPTQLKRATGDGLPFPAMSLSQQERFAELLRVAKPGLPDDALAECSFRISEGSTVKEEADIDTGEPVRYQENYLYFAYIFAPGDEKRSEMFLDSKRLEPEPSPRDAK